MSDCLVIGGGVIGLSAAYELASTGKRVRLLERGELGREASWAGAGILPPPATREDLPPWRRLLTFSYGLHQQWSGRLREETGIDNGLRKCGAIHLARRPGEAAALRADMSELAADGVEVVALESDGDLHRLEKNLRDDQLGTDSVRAAFHLPDEAQIRNPRHLQALEAACRRLNVELHEHTEVAGFTIRTGQVVEVTAGDATFQADYVVVTTGAWSEVLLSQLGLNLSVYPVRGQMILYRCAAPPLTRVVNEGPRYIVPRDDGRVLAGSTEEDVGFDKRTTEEGIRELRHFAEQLLPPLAGAELEHSWAGLRPHAVDGLPYLGRVPHLKNCYVAAGHYRAGLASSTGTAVLLRQLIDGKPLEFDMSEFRLDR